MGSVVGTIKDAIKNEKEVGVLKIKTYRPFPEKAILNVIQKAKYVAVLDKAISLGHIGPLASDLMAITQGKIKAKIQSFIVGLGGRDITRNTIKTIIAEVKKGNENTKFIRSV